MALVVTGLSTNGDLSALHAALVAAELPTAPLQVITPDDSTEKISRGIVGSDLYTREGGTGVPGLSGRSGGTRFFRNESLPDRLGDFEIPDSEIEKYVEALQRGRSVVAYFAHADTVDRVEAIFRDANVINVRRY